MIEEMLPMNLPPGIFKEGTEFEAKGRWSDANLVRFTEDTIRPIGGWRRMLDSSSSPMTQLAGVPRAALSWRGDDGNAKIAVATTTHLYLIEGSILNDVTPTGFTSGTTDSASAGGGGSYGAGVWGGGPYGAGASLSDIVDATTTQLDNFGGFFAAVDTTNKKLYVWEGVPATHAIFPTATGGTIPTASAVVITPERFFMLLNGNLVSWADQESYVDWNFASITNQAGQQPLATSGKLLAGRRGRGATWLWTDTDMWEATYLGLPAVYSFQQKGDHCGLIAPNAVAVVDARAAWMGNGRFYKYEGVVTPINCDVSDYIFANLNLAQKVKIHAHANPRFSEITWYYPSFASNEIDSYATYNYVEDHWTIGTLSRTAGTTDGPTQYPVLITADGYIYEHEFGNNRGGLVPFLTSGPIEFSERTPQGVRSTGDNVIKFKRLIPDEKTLGDVRAYIYTSFFPTDTPVINGPYTLTAPTSIRLTARQIRIKFEENVNTDWRIGNMRFGTTKGGRR